jgi:hypothetical protein
MRVPRIFGDARETMRANGARARPQKCCGSRHLVVAGESTLTDDHQATGREPWHDAALAG